MQKYSVIAINLKTQKEINLEIEADEADTTERIVLHTQMNGEQISASDYNYLPAFQILRDHLLAFGYGIKCKGACLNAIQSGMMGANAKIYLVELGRQALKADIVDIYDYADLDTFPDTCAQIDFCDKWHDSLE